MVAEKTADGVSIDEVATRRKTGHASLLAQAVKDRTVLNHVAERLFTEERAKEMTARNSSRSARSLNSSDRLIELPSDGVFRKAPHRTHQCVGE
jgi:hypothetical protein